MADKSRSAKANKANFELIKQPNPDESPEIDEQFSFEFPLSHPESHLDYLKQIIKRNHEVRSTQKITQLHQQSYENAQIISKLFEEKKNLIKMYQKEKYRKYRYEMDAAIKLSLQRENGAQNEPDFTYEGLLLLGERIGSVNVGLSTDQIGRISEQAIGRLEMCSICLNSGDFGKVLVCGHFFHSECIDKWLSTKKICPMCLTDVVLEE
jgi:hypothetical protein